MPAGAAPGAPPSCIFFGAAGGRRIPSPRCACGFPSSQDHRHGEAGRRAAGLPRRGSRSLGARSRRRHDSTRLGGAGSPLLPVANPAGLPGGERRGCFCTPWNFAADFLLKVMEMGGWWSVAELMSSWLIISPLFYYYYFCIYGAYFPSLFAGRVANGELGWSPHERSGFRSPSVRGQRRGMAPRAAEHKPRAERTPGIYFSQTCSPP